jgi:hypothetical protein
MRFALFYYSALNEIIENWHDSPIQPNAALPCAVYTG